MISFRYTRRSTHIVCYMRWLTIDLGYVSPAAFLTIMDPILYLGWEISHNYMFGARLCMAEPEKALAARALERSRCNPEDLPVLLMASDSYD